MPGEDEPAVESRVNGSAGPPLEGASLSDGFGDRAVPVDPGAPLEPTPVKRSRLLRLIYWLVWFVLLPVVLACLVVWALTPPSAAELGGGIGWVQSLVRAQPVPVGI